MNALIKEREFDAPILILLGGFILLVFFAPIIFLFVGLREAYRFFDYKNRCKKCGSKLTGEDDEYCTKDCYYDK